MSDEVAQRLECKGRSKRTLEDDWVLYKRFTAKEVAKQEEESLLLAAAAFRLPDFSVNCGAFCEPEDVLWPSYDEQGIAQILVRDVPLESTVDNQTIYRLIAEHDPICDKDDEHDNYAHSEVRVLKNETHDRNMKIKSKAIKRELRLHLTRQFKVYQWPNT